MHYQYTNDISNDVFKVICGHGENASWRLRLCRDGSHWLDTLSISNSSSRNWNSWFVATIASLNTVAKMFAKIAKTFAGLSATIIATRRRPVLILHLEAKYAKIDCKNEIYVKNWVKSTWTAKVNSGKKSTVNSLEVKVNAGRVNCLRSTSIWRWRQRWCDLMTSAMMQLGLTWQDDVAVKGTMLTSYNFKCMKFRIKCKLCLKVWKSLNFTSINYILFVFVSTIFCLYFLLSII